MRKVKLNKILLTSLLSSLLAFSCQVGLGEAVDVTAPEIKVTSPTVSQSVSKQFNITGVATDDFGLASVTVDIDGDNFTEHFKWEGSSWKRLENGSWVDYASATSTGDSKNLSFTISVDASAAVSGHEYSITSKATDVYSNENAKTKDERNVIIDTTEPLVSIIEPTRLSSPTDPEFATYVLKNNSVLPKIKNGTFTISGSQREDTTLDYLVVYLDQETTAIDKGTVTIYPVANPLIAKRIDGSNLRNWSTTVSSSEFTDASVLTGDHILRLVTESHDEAGNVEIKSHGWFKFNEAADKPWVSATFGYDNAATSKIVANRCYPRCSLQGQAYDDDGLKSITIKIYEEDGVTEIADYSVSEATLAAEGYPTYKAWSFNALSETKTIVVKASCVDKNGVASEETVTRYLTISDVNPPKISNLSPANGTSLLGTDNGSFSFSGTVDDDGSIDFVKIVRIKTGNEADQMSYFDKDYAGWTNCTSVNNPYTDANGNKVWMLPLGTETTNSENRKVRTWSKTFNIFTDFGIDGNTQKLVNQKFIILAQDVGKSANIEAYSLQGDIEPPELVIETIYINDDTHHYELKDNPIEIPKPFNRDGDLKITDKIKISGTWSDNSTNVWTDKTKRGPFVLKVADKEQKVTLNNNGTWSTGYFSPVDSSVSVITASFTDWGGNVTNKSRSYYVNSSTPVLSRIGAETADGSYSTGAEIKITMEFNKAVKFEPGTPVLKLNAGSGTRTATYDGESNGTSKHVFKYTVQAGDDVAKLNVTGIDKDGCTWIDNTSVNSENRAVIENLTIPTTGGASLGEGRSIVIDTTAPKLSSISAISGAGWNNAGKSIFIQAKFSENISITPEDLAGLKLVFNNGAKTTTATKTGPDTVLFKYLVGASDTYTEALQITSVLSSGYTIADIAGNKLTSITTLPNNLPTTGSSVIKIDTGVPDAPTVQGLPTPQTVYADNFTFTITGFETGASEKKYTLDGSTWLDYTGNVTVSNNGSYTISAYQKDAAGNKSAESTAVVKNLNKNKIISSITAEESDGTYTTGEKITIKLICNEKLTVDTTKTGGLSNAYLTLNTSPEKKAYYLSGSGTTELKFQYTIAEGDNCDAASGLTVTDFVSSKKVDSTGIDFSTRCELPSTSNLANNRTINVVTGAPVITGVTVNQSGTVPVMKIKFSNPVTKKAGKYIKVSQTYSKNGSVVYNAPAVLTKSQYNNFKAVGNGVDTYYEKGVNGVKSDNVTPDLSEKYVLKFTYDGTTAAVREFFRDTVIDATNSGTILDVFIPIASSKVTINPSDKTEMLVTLSDAYKLPVKGAEYTITVPVDIAVDSQGHTNPAASGKTYSAQQTFTLNGEEKPVIRVNKAECTVKNNVATQPLTAQIKMDCQTAGKTINYKITETETKTKVIDESMCKSGRISPNNAETSTNSTGTYSSTALYLGSSSNKSSGYKYVIEAYSGSTKTADNTAYETACRSVIRLIANDPGIGGDMGGFKDPGNMSNVYVRGGDSESGNSSTLGFPLSWNSGDFGKVKMMTVDSDVAKCKYYVSWNLSVNTYFGFLAGNVGSSDADTMANGPLNWCWASCGWVSRKHLYYLVPGTSFTMDANTNNNNLNIGGFQYQGKHLEYRPQATNKQGAPVSSIN